MIRKKPNLQNIPIRTEAGKRIREALRNGSVMLEFDYAEIEKRALETMEEPGPYENWEKRRKS